MYWVIVFLRSPQIDGPLPRKNEGKEKLVDFKTLIVSKDEDNVFMLGPMEELPTLLPTICGNEDVNVIELFMNLLALSEIAYPLTVSNIQQHQAGDVWLVQTTLV